MHGASSSYSSSMSIGYETLNNYRDFRHCGLVDTVWVLVSDVHGAKTAILPVSSRSRAVCGDPKIMGHLVGIISINIIQEHPLL